MSRDLNIVMEYCCLEFWIETSEECCIVLMDEETSAPAPQRVIYKKPCNSERKEPLEETKC